MADEPSGRPDPEAPAGRGGSADWTRALREAAPYLSIGTTSAASVALGLAAGYWLDGKLGTRPLLFLCGGVFGIFAALLQVYRLVMSRKR